MTFGEQPSRGPPSPFLERLTAAVLAAVLAALGWMLAVSSEPGWLRLPWVEVEVVVVAALLAAALVLVSVLALRQTRGTR